jgi:hypothetical protein
MSPLVGSTAMSDLYIRAISITVTTARFSVNPVACKPGVSAIYKWDADTLAMCSAGAAILLVSDV